MQKLTVGIAGFVVLLLIIGFVLPSQSRFVVSTTVNAHPPTIYALINDLRRAALWSPITANDPSVHRVYSGPVRGSGASTSWDSPIAGSGTQTITESRPYEYVETLINAGEPGEVRTWFILNGSNGETNVDWGFEHDYGLNIIGRYFGLMATGVIRHDYQNGLGNLKELAESLPVVDFSDLQFEHLRVEPIQIAYVSTASAPLSAAKSEALGAAYFEVLSFIEKHSLQAAGAPLSIARAFSGAERRFDAGIPIRGVGETTPRSDGRVRIGETYGGTVIRVTHVGGYGRLFETHRKTAAYLAALGIEKTGDAWESYVSDPAEVDDRELLTHLYYPIRDL